MIETETLDKIKQRLLDCPIYPRIISRNLSAGFPIRELIPAADCAQLVIINEEPKIEAYIAKLVDYPIHYCLIEDIRGISDSRRVVTKEDPLHSLLKSLKDKDYVTFGLGGFICEPED